MKPEQDDRLRARVVFHQPDQLQSSEIMGKLGNPLLEA